MSNTIYNFSAGPARLPDEVFAQLQADLRQSPKGASIMEVSHRGEDFQAIAAASEQNLRTVLAIPDDFAVLFMQGGARGQFSAVPLNLLGAKQRADYLITGHWSAEAAKEAQRHGTVQIATDNSLLVGDIPPPATWQLDSDAAYVHYTDNETIQGIEFSIPPKVSVPLVADMTSNLLTKPIDWSQYGAVYAAAQKNLGIAGLTIVIVRKNLLGQACPHTPSVLNYQTFYKTGSCYNTPPVFNWYVSHLLFQWVQQQGGLIPLAQRCAQQAQTCYQFIDNSKLYVNKVVPTYRSRLNIVFELRRPALSEKLLSAAAVAGFQGIRGHRKQGGFRISLYLGIPASHITALLTFLSDFERMQG